MSDPPSGLRSSVIHLATRPLGRAGPPIARAMSEVPRELFISSEFSALAYDDRHLPAISGHTLQPLGVIARMIAALEPNAEMRVLEVGTGAGYTAAVLSKLVREVRTMDRDANAAEVARRNLKSLGIKNVSGHVGDGSALKAFAPFDGILISEAILGSPQTLRDLLKVGGRLVYTEGPPRGGQSLFRITRVREDDYKEENLGPIHVFNRIGDILVDLGLAGREDVDRAADNARKVHRRTGEVLQAEGKIEENDLYRALAAQRGLKFGTVDALMHSLDLSIVRSLPRSFLEHNRILPIRDQDNLLTLATSDPDIKVEDLLAVLSPRRLEVCLVTPSDFRRMWAVIELMLSDRHGRREPSRRVQDEQILESVSRELDAYYIRLFETLLLDAIGERASDIHLEQFGELVRVRIRVDGDLRDLTRYQLNPNDLLGLINVIKIRSNLDIAEHRLPQGGRVRIKVAGRTFDLRVQTQPALYAEHAVIRILPQDVRLLSIDDLGLSPLVANAYRRTLDEPSGLILVVGPTGSGKTTTLYAGLQVLAKDPTRKVITVEDPIEYSLDGVQQTAARPEIGFAFANAMRSFVRQDPDVILVGEIRDAETALEAIRASQTGHLVFSTLHCNDTTDAIQRLLDLGIHPNSIASELIAVMAQRLPRRICGGCRVEGKPDAALLKEIFPSGPPPSFRSYQGRGCSRCQEFGTYGRIACVEFLRVEGEFRAAISRHPSVEELRRIGVGSGMMTMRDAALELVERKLIAIDELPYLLPSERLGPETASKEAGFEAGGRRPVARKPKAGTIQSP